MEAVAVSIANFQGHLKELEDESKITKDRCTFLEDGHGNMNRNITAI